MHLSLKVITAILLDIIIYILYIYNNNIIDDYRQLYEYILQKHYYIVYQVVFILIIVNALTIIFVTSLRVIKLLVVYITVMHIMLL